MTAVCHRTPERGTLFGVLGLVESSPTVHCMGSTKHRFSGSSPSSQSLCLWFIVWLSDPYVLWIKLQYFLSRSPEKVVLNTCQCRLLRVLIFSGKNDIWFGLTASEVHINHSSFSSYRDLRRSQAALWIQWPILTLLSLSTSFSGLVLYAEYQNCDPIASNQISNSDQVVLHLFLVLGCCSKVISWE